MRVLVDTNIVLDFLLQREPFFQEAKLLFQAISSGEVVGYITATTITDIFYIAQKQTKNIEQARQAVSLVLRSMEVCSVDRVVLELAMNSGLADFEDAVQIQCAVAQELDAIMTRDKKGFLESSVQVLSVTTLLQKLSNR